MNKKSLLMALCVIAVVIVIAVLLKTNNDNKDSQTTAAVTEKTSYVDNNFENFDYAEGISGFYSDYDSQTTPEIYGITLPYEDKTNKFEIINIGRYTGTFMEDGSDENVVNVLAMLVKNTGDSMLEFLQIQFTDSDGETYTFKISALPAGKECLVLESEKTEYKDGVVLEIQEIIPSYKDDVSMMKDEISFNIDYEEETNAAQFAVTNVSDRDLDTIYVCYKTVENGIYIGGITYRTTFEDLKQGETLTNTVSHFYEGASNIVLIEEGE